MYHNRAHSKSNTKCIKMSIPEEVPQQGDIEEYIRIYLSPMYLIRAHSKLNTKCINILISEEVQQQGDVEEHITLHIFINVP